MNQDQKISLWDTSAAEEDYTATMDGDITTELAIVGGGFTGLSTGDKEEDLPLPVTKLNSVPNRK